MTSLSCGARDALAGFESPQATKRLGKTAWLCGVAVFAFADAASAANTSGGSQQVEEVVVTARHRDESLQKVPISVAVVSGASAAAKSLKGVADISAELPSVNFRTGASNKDRTIFVRGVGTISTSPGVEPSVSTVLDGVVLARPGQATEDLLDIDHIEVLRGPQGTLFGKNASAGVVNIVTKAPTSHLTGALDASYFEGNEYRVAGLISGPITDQIKGSVSFFTGHYDGNVKDLTTGGKVNGYDHTGGRIKLVASPTSTLTLTVSGDYTRSTDTTPSGVWASSSQTAYPTGKVTRSAALATALAAEGVTPSADNRTISDNQHTNVHDQNGGAALQADWDVGDGYKVTSISAWRGWSNNQVQDYDQSSTLNASLPQVEDIGRVLFHQTSEELRLASPKDRFVDFVAGLYYLSAVDHETYQRNVLRVVSGSDVADNGVNHYGSSDSNYALFGEANINFTKTFRAIAGLRGVLDDLSFYTNRVSTATTTHTVTGVQPSFKYNASSENRGVAGRFGLQYDVSADISAYATYSHGYKGPAYNVFFNQARANTGLLNPETSNSYEVGLKSRALDGRLQLNLAGFITDFTNFQANSTQIISGALVTNLVNAGTVTSRGVELDAIAKPISGLTLNFNGSYDDAHIVNFPCPAGSALSCHVNGEPLPFAPRWKFHTEADYRTRLTDLLDIDVDTEYNWQSQTQYQLSQTPDTIQPAYGILNASLGLIDSRDGWTGRVLVKNIADQHYSSYLSHGNLGGLVRWVPRDDDRYVGVNAHKDF